MSQACAAAESAVPLPVCMTIDLSICHFSRCSSVHAPAPAHVLDADIKQQSMTAAPVSILQDKLWFQQ